jgi:hypothetical protein
MSSYSLLNLVKDFICNYTGVIVNRVNSRPLGFGRLYCLFNSLAVYALRVSNFFLAQSNSIVQASGNTAKRSHPISFSRMLSDSGRVRCSQKSWLKPSNGFVNPRVISCDANFLQTCHRDRCPSTPFSRLITPLDCGRSTAFSPEIHVSRRALSNAKFQICAKVFYRVLVVGSSKT